MDDAQLLATVRAELANRPAVSHTETAQIIRRETAGVVSDVKVLEILRTLREETHGAGVLDTLLRRPGVSDVLVTAPGEVWIDEGNGLERADVTFASEEDVRAYAVRLASRCGRRLDDAQPWADGHIPGGVGGNGVRVHAVLSPPSATSTQISLRVLRPAQRGLTELCDAELFPPEVLPLLRAIVAEELSFIVAGGTGAGKTTLLAAMLTEVALNQRIVCIEDTPELQPRHPHVVKLVTRAANLEGAGAIGQQELLRQALRMRPDRIVVGEIRGAEVVDLLAALNTGHRGGAGTIHANRIGDIVARFEALGLIGGLRRDGLDAQLVSAVQVVLVVERTRVAHVSAAGARTRRLAQIGLLRGNPPEVVSVWTDREGPGPAWDELQQLLAGEEK